MLSTYSHVWSDTPDDNSAAAAAAPLLQGPAATKDHGHPDAFAVGTEFPATVCHSQILGSEDRATWPHTDTGAPNDRNRSSG